MESDGATIGAFDAMAAPCGAVAGGRLDHGEQAGSQHAAFIREAMAGGLTMAFQPICFLEDGRVTGREALARFGTGPRWSPEQWFARAWEVGLGFELEMAAFGRAVAAAAQHPDPSWRLGVNLAPAVITDSRLAAQMEACPVVDRLVIEVTEHAVIDDYGPLVRSLETFRAAGARVAVDDAGAGYASLRHVLMIRPDIVKLDRSLISGIHADEAKQAMAVALISAAAGMGADVVAEGIEEESELSCVTGLGAQFGQGYLLGRPGPLPR